MLLKTIYLLILISYFSTISGLRIFKQTSVSARQVVNYFDCNSYNYFPNTELPQLTPKDSFGLIKYAEKIDFVKYIYMTGDTNIHVLSALLPRVQGKIDTALYDKLMIEDKEYDYKKLDNDFLLKIVENDAVIIGEVIDKRYEADPEKCLYFLTSYVIEVKEVLNSHFPLKAGNKVLVKDIMGDLGGCVQGNEKIYVTMPHVKEYNKGSINIFFLTKKLYHHSMNIIKKTYKWNDTYCSQAFRIHMDNSN